MRWLTADRWVTLGVLAVCGVFFYRCDAAANRKQGALAQQLRDLETRNGRLLAANNSLAVRFRTETVTVRVTRQRFDTLIDSITRFDTIALTHRETVIVVRAQEALNACQEALGTCVQSLRIRDQIIANRDSALRVVLKQRPSFFDKVRNGVVIYAAGYLTAKVVK